MPQTRGDFCFGSCLGLYVGLGVMRCFQRHLLSLQWGWAVIWRCRCLESVMLLAVEGLRYHERSPYLTEHDNALEPLKEPLHKGIKVPSLS